MNWLGQLFPRVHWQVLALGVGPSKKHFVIWKSWLGRKYDVVEFEV